MILFDFVKLKQHRFREGQVLRAIGEILVSGPYYIKSVSNKYSLEERLNFRGLCRFTHPGGFDLILLEADHGLDELIGVEVKSVLSMNSYQSALGQCFVYMNEDKYRNKLKEVIIFAHKFQNPKIFEYIRRDFQTQKQKTSIPMRIRTIIGANGPYGQREIT